MLKLIQFPLYVIFSVFGLDFENSFLPYIGALLALIYLVIVGIVLTVLFVAIMFTGLEMLTDILGWFFEGNN